VITHISIFIEIINFHLKAIKQFVISNTMTVEMSVFLFVNTKLL
jgi:hypothetical protein